MHIEFYRSVATDLDGLQSRILKHMSVYCRNKPPLRLSVEHNANYDFELGFSEIYIERKSCDAGWDTIGDGGHHACLSAQIPGRKASGALHSYQ